MDQKGVNNNIRFGRLQLKGYELHRERFKRDLVCFSAQATPPPS